MPSVKTSSACVRLAPYIWTHQFTFLTPDHCFVLDDGNGRAVGYCIGCPDITAFCAAYPRYVSEVVNARGKQNGDIQMVPSAEQLAGERASWIDPDTGRISELSLSQLVFSEDQLLMRGNEDIYDKRYMATMHIDLLDEFQGKGWGKKLLEMVVGSMKDVKVVDEEEKGKSVGVWLGVGGDNGKVVPFYEKLGFRLMQREKAPGSITMVRDY